MKQKFLKKLSILSMGIISVGFFTFIPVYAAENTQPPQEYIEELGSIQPRDVNYYQGKLWEYVSTTSAGQTKGGRSYITEHKAGPKGKGETLVISTEISLSATFSGSINLGSANTAAGQLGWSIGASHAVGAARTSRGLKNNERVVAYSIPVYYLRTVKEREISYILKNGKYTKYQATGKTRTGTVKIPKTVDVEFVYNF